MLEAQQRAGTPAAPFPGKPGPCRGLSWSAPPTPLTRDSATHWHLSCRSVGPRARGSGLVLPSGGTMRAVRSLLLLGPLPSRSPRGLRTQGQVGLSPSPSLCPELASGRVGCCRSRVEFGQLAWCPPSRVLPWEAPLSCLAALSVPATSCHHSVTLSRRPVPTLPPLLCLASLPATLELVLSSLFCVHFFTF